MTAFGDSSFVHAMHIPTLISAAITLLGAAVIVIWMPGRPARACAGAQAAAGETAGTGIGNGLRRAPSREALLRLEQLKAGVIRAHSGGFHLAATGDLIRTCVIEVVLAAVVITSGAGCGVPPPPGHKAARPWGSCDPCHSGRIDAMANPNP